MNEDLSEADRQILEELLQTSQTVRTILPISQDKSGEFLSRSLVFEVGPQLTFETAWSSNAISIFKSASPSLAACVPRVERSWVYKFSGGLEMSSDEKDSIMALVHDRMTQMVYHQPLNSFSTGRTPDPVTKVYILDEDGINGWLYLQWTMM